MNFPSHFTEAELTLSQTATRNGIDNTPSDEIRLNLVRLAWFLESLRTKLNAHYGKAVITVSSGYRCPELNKAIGGSETSAHMKGLAADINVPGLKPIVVARFINNNMVEEGFDQVIHEFGRWVHIGLCEGVPRLQELTAIKEDGRAVYKTGLF